MIWGNSTRECKIKNVSKRFSNRGDNFRDNIHTNVITIFGIVGFAQFNYNLLFHFQQQLLKHGVYVKLPLQSPIEEPSTAGNALARFDPIVAKNVFKFVDNYWCI